jgi:hypothetical protein
LRRCLCPEGEGGMMFKLFHAFLTFVSSVAFISLIEDINGAIKWMGN